MRGRPRKPEALKDLKGTSRPSRKNTNSPKVAKGIPEVPARVRQDEIATEFYMRITKHLHSMKVITMADEIALEQLCIMYSEMAELEKQIVEKGGRVVKSYTKNGHTEKTRPEVQQLLEIRRQFNTQLQQFGLTPATREKVNAEAPGEQGDLFEGFLGKAPMAKVS